MKKLIHSTAITVALLAGAPIGNAQTPARDSHPDFSGKWVVDLQASSPGLVLDGEQLVQPFLTNRARLQPSFANTFVASQIGTALRVQREAEWQGVTTILNVVYYKLDGSESPNVEGEMTKTVSTSQWQNGTLTIVTRFDDPAALPRNDKLVRVMSLDANGRLLVETTVNVALPYLTVYRRAS